MTHRVVKQELRKRAQDLGFALFGVAPAVAPPHADAIRRWTAAGMHGAMAYLDRDLERRCHPQAVLEGAHSIIVVGATYSPPPPSHQPGIARYAAYALGDDYHDFLMPSLRELERVLIDLTDCQVSSRTYIDTGPLPEREYANLAGLGWFGKNSMLISPRLGSYFMLGLIITDASLEPDTPTMGHCGTCTRCIEACPTGAIVAPYTVDARLCLSYQTIEQKETIPPQIALRMGDHVFGCDICQEVCPFNRWAPTGRLAGFLPRPGVTDTPVAHVAVMTDDEFRSAFKSSPIKRAKRRGLVRNAVAALSGSDDAGAAEAIERAMSDPDILVRNQAAISSRATTNTRQTVGRTGSS